MATIPETQLIEKILNHLDLQRSRHPRRRRASRCRTARALPRLASDTRHGPVSTTFRPLRAGAKEIPCTRFAAMSLASGMKASQRTPAGWFGGADPCREGVVMGD